MLINKINTENKSDIEFIEKIYIESFPIEERRSVAKFNELIENEKIFSVFLLLEKEQRIGFITYWKFETFIFIEHFAVSPEFRNGGYGKEAVELFKEQVDLPILLEVELPETPIAQRRIQFYERLGFRLWSIDYAQPPYEDGYEQIPMKLMTYGYLSLDKAFSSVKNDLYTKVYKQN